MGIADLFIKLGIKYGDKESLELSDKIGRLMINSALQQSALLAKEYGAYPMFNLDYVLASPFIQANADPQTIELIKKYGLRNSQLLTIAPTGSLSTMLGISGGIEPFFNLSYTRRTQSLHGQDVSYKVFTPIVKEYMEFMGIEKEEDLPDIFVTAMSLDYRDRIAMQSVWQKYIDASISSTVNVPSNFTVEQVENLYKLAWRKGLKGITIFRDKCERMGILTNDDEDKTQLEEVVEEPVNDDSVDKCPECGGVMFRSGGCKECKDCGYSPCAL
jgi:ribonucleoside-diphosphate reductase alpha chain